jgi:hypothetical protein
MRAHLSHSLPRAAPRSALLLRRFTHAHAPEVPPIGVRASLVGGAVAFATPLFPIIGFIQLAYRWLTLQQRLVHTGGTSMAYFSLMVAAPQTFYSAAPQPNPRARPFMLTGSALLSASCRRNVSRHA